ncbi:amino acid/amide ABC transporter membrane protein 2 (HAAT family) [Humitalea rosea]|uniref:Amino acid/amide ABC transporter membrane protein 2 (HAAT family) n=1 Tax=Humitalea rosea TaxID=990373 RepID=A0A2W7I263_9PROT|nr:branched-chain amino acid ABC transporter permease [Humitalea rosea]PZW39345.1 amino acid/amide ABC transporter membrane protein 2 (HAAT family) [Humitalea rosea]
MTVKTEAALRPRPALPAGHIAFWGGAALLCLALVAGFRVLDNEYAWFAGYFILQYVLLATAWNILGGYAGYVNFGAAGFLAVGAYTTVALRKAFGLDLLPCIAAAACIGGLLGLGTGWLALRLKGVYFAIATLSLAVLLHTIVVNWSFVGGSRGAYVLRPASIPPFVSYGEYLFVVMLVLAVIGVGIARGIEGSRLGMGLAALRDDERAAEAAGVPTLRLKLVATTLSGALMAVAGAPLSHYTGYLNPEAAFGLAFSVNAIAMPLIGGAGTWFGPVIGAVLLASLQQAATVTISSAANLMIVGVVLVIFAAAAPRGIVGLIRGGRHR